MRTTAPASRLLPLLLALWALPGTGLGQTAGSGVGQTAGTRGPDRGLWAATAPPAAVAITNARILPVAGPAIERGTLVLRDGRIAAVGGPDLPVPPGARILDATGKTVTPGLLDSVTHLGALEIDLVESTADFSSEEDRITAAFEVADGINPFSTAIPITRVEGITRAVVTPEAAASLVAGQGALIDLSGGPLDSVVTRDPVAMYAALGEAGAARTGGARGAAVLRLREVLQDARDFAANREAFEANQRREYAVSRLDLEALVPVVEGRLPLAVTVHRASDIAVALRLARELGLRLVLLGASEGWMMADEIARARVPVVLNPLQNVPTFERLGATLENAARLHAAGVPVAFATWETHNSRTLKQGAGNALAHGLPYEAALRAVTLTPAEIWGVAERYGSLEPGKDADVVIWSGDPFELTTRVEGVFIRGREMPATTRQQELLEKYRRLPSGVAGRLPGVAPAAPRDPAAPPEGALGRPPGPTGEAAAQPARPGTPVPPAAPPGIAPDAPPDTIAPAPAPAPTPVPTPPGAPTPVDPAERAGEGPGAPGLEPAAPAAPTQPPVPPPPALGPEPPAREGPGVPEGPTG